MRSIAHLAPNADERFFASKVDDMLKAAKQRVRFSQFSDERDLEIANCVATGFDGSISIFGGYDGAERNILCFSPSYIEVPKEDFPITAVQFTFRKSYAITHRDVLGTLMAQGIKRETIGDILIGEGEVVVYVLKQLAQPIIYGVTKIGRVGVLAQVSTNNTLIALQNTEEGSGFLNSLRIDAVIAILIGISREKAQNLISSGLVKINGKSIEKVFYEVHGEDKISIRGHGKFKINSNITTTKRNRLRITFNKYI